MGLTSQDVVRYKGGQMEIQNQKERCLYRGEIEAITVENGTLRVKFTWLAKGEGYPPIPKKWVRDAKSDYTANLEIYSVSNIGPSNDEIGGDDRIFLISSIVGETVVLYPPNGSKLDPAKIEGLQLARA